MKETNSFDYFMAQAVCNLLNYKPIADSEDSERDHGEVVLHSQIINPELAAIKADNFEKLSKEAKQIIMLIVWGPIDFFDNIETEHFRKVTLRKVRGYFSKQLGKKKTSTAIKEIQQWINEA